MQRHTRFMVPAAVAAVVALAASGFSAAGAVASGPPDPAAVLEQVTDRALVAGTVTPPGSDLRHATTELPAYDSLVQTYPLLDVEPERVLRDHFKDGRFRPVDDPERIYHPRGDVTVVRDRKWGVPHIYGATDEAMFFGAGYTTAEDRLVIFELLRVLGRSEAFELLGTTPAWLADFEMARLYGYTESEFQAMIDRVPALYDRPGDPIGTEIVAGLDAYVDGLNAYLVEAARGEVPIPVGLSDLMAATGKKFPGPYRATDVVAATSTVRAMFGAGGGGELGNVGILASLQERLGTEVGREVYEDLRNRDNRDGPTHTADVFPYMTVPAGAGAANVGAPTSGATGLATLLSDLASGDVGLDPALLAGDLSSLASDLSSLAERAATDWDRLRLEAGGAVIDLSRAADGAMSNWLAVDGSRTASGHPIVIGGPQAGYFSPQIFNEYEMHGETIHARGAGFPGLTALVIIGRTQDYAFTATAGGSDMVDTYVEFLCEPDGRAADERSVHYLFDVDGDGTNECLPMERRVIRRATDLLGHGAGTKQLPDIVVERTLHGPVKARGELGGAPVAVTSKRSTYLKELDAAVSMARLNRNEATTAQDFVDIMTETHNLSTNWVYASSDEIGYVHGGLYPIRPRTQHPDMPVLGTGAHEWAYDVVPASDAVAGDIPVPRPGGAVEWRRDRRLDVHPNQVPGEGGPDHLASWNNRPAPGWGSADNSWNRSSLYRSSLLEEGLVDETSTGHKITVAEVVQIMEEAGLTDLRGRFVAPLALEVLGDVADLEPELQTMVAVLRDWIADDSELRPDGSERVPDFRALRRDGDDDGRYDDSSAVAIMDAWWSPLVREVFDPVLGNASIIRGGFDNAPNSGGSAYQSGLYGHVLTALAQVLGDGTLAAMGLGPVASIHLDGLESPFSVRYCGGRLVDDVIVDGDLATCRARIVASLRSAAAALTSESGSADPSAWEADPAAERLLFLPGVFLSMHWVNRPTTQVVASFGVDDNDDLHDGVGPDPTPRADGDPTGPKPPRPLSGFDAADLPTPAEALTAAGDLVSEQVPLGPIGFAFLAALVAVAVIGRRRRPTTPPAGRPDRP